jgi:hypothetical protein
MSDPRYAPRRMSPHGVVRADLAPPPSGPSSLADILERVLDKGIVIAGDIQVNLLDIELLTIKIRLLVASVDRAKEMGINWWEGDPTLTSGAKELQRENEDLRTRLERLEERLALVAQTAEEQAPAAATRTEVSEQRRETSDARRGRTVSEGTRKRVTEGKR